MSEYHEPTGELSARAQNFHRALKSLTEEVDAIDWYQQRIDATDDAGLAKILAHNRDEEIEHAALLLEWLRRNMPGWDERLQEFLFSVGDVVEEEERKKKLQASIASSLGIGGRRA